MWHGIRVWQNGDPVHRIERYVAYHNGHAARAVDGRTVWRGAGISHGAYNNRYQYINCMLYANAEAGIRLLAQRRPDEPRCLIDVVPPSERMGFWHLMIDQAELFDYAVRVKEHNAKGQAVLFDSCDFRGYRQAALAIDPLEGNPELSDLVRCTFARNKPWFHISANMHLASCIRVQQENGFSLEIRRHDYPDPPGLDLVSAFKPEWRHPEDAVPQSPRLFRGRPCFCRHLPIAARNLRCLAGFG
jgi:hypothetical protein